MSSTRIKAVTVYQAADGQQYETMYEAQEASARHIAREKISSLLQKKVMTGGLTVNTLTADFITNPDFAQQFRSAINAALDYQRRYGKLSKKQGTASAKG